MNKISRELFFKDKELLLFLMFGIIASFYLYVTYIGETFFFIIPTFMFCILGLFEIWYILEKRNSHSIGEQIQKHKEVIKKDGNI